MKTVVIQIVLGLLLFGNPAQADEMKNLKLRIEGHVNTMMRGERAPMLTVKDYYSTVYVTSKATVENLAKQPNGNYLVSIKFETTGRIQQDAEQTPWKKSEVKKKEDIKVKLTFKVEPKSIKWIEKLETPFVKAGSETRYILEAPPAKTATKSSATPAPADTKAATLAETKSP